MNPETELIDNELAVVGGVRGSKKNEQKVALRDALLHDPRATILAVALIAVLLLALSTW